jgi:hypothetical protein
MTWIYDSGQQNEHLGNKCTAPNVNTTESEVVNLFTIGASKDMKKEKETKPFTHQVQFHGPQGEIVRAWANIDDGAMKEVMLLE